MILISHRGNLTGPCPAKENNPEQIEFVIQRGYNCEVDVWIKETQLFLGHDEPAFATDEAFLQKHKAKLWCHAKNLEALEWLSKNDYQTFFHDVDDYVLTSKNIVWAYPGKRISNNTVCVLPEQRLDAYPREEYRSAYGICTDYVETFATLLQKDVLASRPRVAIIFAGRVKGYEDSLFWLKDVIIKYNADTFCSINGECDEYHKKFLNELRIQGSHFEKYVCPGNLLNVTSKRSETNIYNACSMFHNTNRAFQLAEQYQTEHGFVYDIVLYARADIVTNERLSLEMQSNVVSVPLDNDYGGLNDQLAYGDFASMKHYTELYNFIDSYCHDRRVTFHPEILVDYHMKAGQVNVRRFSWKYALSCNRQL